MSLLVLSADSYISRIRAEIDYPPRDGSSRVVEYICTYSWITSSRHCAYTAYAGGECKRDVPTHPRDASTTRGFWDDVACHDPLHIVRDDPCPALQG
jgi:hypothetical protein